jgi:hypothetical protein
MLRRADGTVDYQAAADLAQAANNGVDMSPSSQGRISLLRGSPDLVDEFNSIMNHQNLNEIK